MKIALHKLCFCIPIIGMMGVALPAFAEEDYLLRGNDSIPQSWQTPLFSEEPLSPDFKWWDTFHDDALTRIVALAVDNNYSARAALSRIKASAQAVRQAKAGYYPNLSLSLGYTGMKDSGNETVPHVSPPTNTFWTANATMSWQPDIFGRVQKKVKAGKINAQISKLEYDALMLSLIAEIADDYGTLRMYERQLNVALSHIVSQEEVVRIVEARFKNGLVSKLDLAQAQNTLYTTRLMIPSLKANVAVTENALATLCGVSVADMKNLLAENTHLQLNTPPGIGVPADLLRRRPDVLEAEQRIGLLANQVGIAKQDWLPTLAINATIGTTSHEMKGLFTHQGMRFNVAPTLSWTVFDGMARAAGVAEAKANLEAEIEDYNNTISQAFMEANNAILQYRADSENLDLYDDLVTNSQETLNLALTRYKLGLTDFSDVATAQMTLLTNQTNRETARNECFSSLVNLYKALAGGY